ncbi:MAG: hypothetical protein ACFFAU_13870 [Candidatus Hodarchaeota archaeon]
MLIAEDSFSAWIKVLKYIFDNGIRVGSFREISNLLIEIKNPSKTAENNVYFNSVGTNKYFTRFKELISTQKHFPGKGSYLARLKKGIYNFDQIEEIINTLLKWPQAKCATLILIQPGKDHEAARFRCGNMPCISQLDCRIRKGYFKLTAIIRSEDVFLLGYPDYYFLGKFQENIIDIINSKPSKALINHLNLHNEDKLKSGSLFCFIINGFYKIKDEINVKNLFAQAWSG